MALGRWEYAKSFKKSGLKFGKLKTKSMLFNCRAILKSCINEVGGQWYLHSQDWLIYSFLTSHEQNDGL